MGEAAPGAAPAPPPPGWEYHPDLPGPEYHFLRRIGTSGQDTPDIAEWTPHGWATQSGPLPTAPPPGWEYHPDISGYQDHPFLRRIGTSGQDTPDIAEWTPNGWATQSGRLPTPPPPGWEYHPDISGYQDHPFLRRIGTSGQDTPDIAEWTPNGWATGYGRLGPDGKPLASGRPDGRVRGECPRPPPRWALSAWACGWASVAAHKAERPINHRRRPRPSFPTAGTTPSPA